MKNRRLWVLLVGIVMLSAAFLLLDFRVAYSGTHAEKNSATASSGDRLPDAMQRRDKISVVLVGEGPFVSALQEALMAEIAAAGLGQAQLVQAPDPAMQNPVLVVNVGNPQLIWTPFFATGQFAIEAGYASNGDTSFMDDTPIEHKSIDGPTISLSADYKVNDQTWGLISRPGYHAYLADYLAKQIVATLRDQYYAAPQVLQ